MKILFPVNASIGIIGGSDGPTAIFVSGSPAMLAIGAVVLASVIVLAVLFIRKSKKK